LFLFVLNYPFPEYRKYSPTKFFVLEKNIKMVYLRQNRIKKFVLSKKDAPYWDSYQ